MIAHTTGCKEFTRSDATVAGKKDMESGTESERDAGHVSEEDHSFVGEIHRFNKRTAGLSASICGGRNNYSDWSYHGESLF